MHVELAPPIWIHQFVCHLAYPFSISALLPRTRSILVVLVGKKLSPLREELTGPAGVQTQGRHRASPSATSTAMSSTTFNTKRKQAGRTERGGRFPTQQEQLLLSLAGDVSSSYSLLKRIQPVISVSSRSRKSSYTALDEPTVFVPCFSQEEKSIPIKYLLLLALITLLFYYCSHLLGHNCDITNGVEMCANICVWV